MTPRVPEALRRFIWDIQSMVELADGPREILFIGRDLMRRLVAESGWLPPEFSAPGETPRLYELYHDEMERFAVVASVLAAGQGWPCFADGVWEIRGVLQGTVSLRGADAAEAGRALAAGEVETTLGQTATALAHAGSQTPAIVIHVFGADIGRRARPVVSAGGGTAEGATPYANAEMAPAYDILSIQAEIVD